MANRIVPKKENTDKGFHYTVSDEQIAQYAKWTLLEKLTWLEETAKFIYNVQTPEERERMKRVKHE